MNTALSNTIIAMATAALGFTAGCSSESPEGEESTTGGDGHGGFLPGVAEEPAAEPAAEEGAAEASCGEGSCG
ncbi:MAG: hypothetical protein IPH72_27035 [Sandaracinaceae bacterium]|nr:hypothetical protein [Sandaracinaceae bacterium]